MYEKQIIYRNLFMLRFRFNFTCKCLIFVAIILTSVNLFLFFSFPFLRGKKKQLTRLKNQRLKITQREGAFYQSE